MSKPPRLNWNGNRLAQQQADEAYEKLRSRKGKSKKRKQRSKPKRHRRVDYQTYLKSDSWKAKRAAAILDAGGRCSKCQSTRNLQAHHRTYRNLGNEKPGDLVVLCGDCHQDHHLAEVLGVEEIPWRI